MKAMKKNAWFKSIAVMVALGVLWVGSGCASKRMVITTKPDEAEIFVNDESIGDSPAEYQGTKKTVTIRAEKEGYGVAMKVVKPEWNDGCIVLGVVLGVLFFPLGFIVIPFCREMPSNVYLKLEQEKEGVSELERLIQDSPDT